MSSVGSSIAVLAAAVFTLCADAAMAESNRRPPQASMPAARVSPAVARPAPEPERRASADLAEPDAAAEHPALKSISTGGIRTIRYGRASRVYGVQ